MDIVLKKKLNMLIHLAEADKHFAKVERDMIYRIAHHHGFPEDEIIKLIQNPEPIEALGALSATQKADYLLSSVEMIFIDQKVFESEILLGRSIAIKLGFHKNVIDYLIGNFEKKGLEELKKTIFEEYQLT